MSFAAELWGLRDGLLQCLNLHLPTIEIEIDAKSIVDLLNNSRNANNVISPLVDDCRYLITNSLGFESSIAFERLIDVQMP